MYRILIFFKSSRRIYLKRNCRFQSVWLQSVWFAIELFKSKKNLELSILCLKWWVEALLISSWICSTWSPWPMIIYFHLTDHTAFAFFFCFLEGILLHSLAHQLNNLSFSIQLSISHKPFEISARTSLLWAVNFLLILLQLMHISVSATRFRSFCIIQEY